MAFHKEWDYEESRLRYATAERFSSTLFRQNSLIR